MFFTPEDLVVLAVGLMIAVFISGSVLHGINSEIEYRKAMNPKPARKKPTQKAAPVPRKV